MPLTAAAIEALAPRCAPAVAPATLVALAHTESRFEPLAIGVNGPTPRTIVAPSSERAEAVANELIQAGANIDLGLLQVNSRNLARLGLSVAAAFEPCRNLQAGAQVLRDGYRRAAPVVVGAQAALRVALSYYNTGRPDRGFQNGYVARVTGWAPRGPLASPLPVDPPPPAPAWDVFARVRPATFVIAPLEGATP